MRRILVSCAVLSVLTMLTLTAVAAARGPAAAKPGYLVVTKAVGNGGVNGDPVVAFSVQGFVLVSVSGKEAQVSVIQLPSVGNEGAPRVVGTDYSSSTFKYRGHFKGNRYTGSSFRIRATGGTYRVIVRGAGVYLFAGGHFYGAVRLQGSSINGHADGRYAIDGGRWKSLPNRPVMRKIGGG